MTVRSSTPTRGIRARAGRYGGASVATAMGAALLTVLITVLDRVHRAGPGHGPEKTVQALLGLVGGTSGLATLLLVANTLSLVVQQRRREIGTLRLIGATPGQIRTRLVTGAAVAGALGGLVGAAAGSAVAGPVLGWLIRNEVLPYGPTAGFSPLGFVLGAGCVVAVSVPAALAAVRGPLRVPAVAALREATVERRALPPGRAVAGR
ncbi:ABC transporter permease [Streptomyces sp. MST-110588]|uniref:FtsX-like permease family protein n=1 Tax=Streptomyces sp. MST-110588 TaxID=2833628 RepID=UPI001F5D0D47|nr:ABC transporter permease [Streptomyces sp. MST-110588]UNO38542.1 FtsX-like permease family protein [Streptomyces sp. MST-110588]